MPWNIARYEVEGEVGSDGLCPVCNENDSPRHLICHCTDPFARQIRTDGERALQRVQHDSPSDTGVEELIDTLRAMRSDGSCWSIWTGMWQKWQRVRLLDALRHVGIIERELRSVRRTFVNISRVMVVITASLFARRHEQMRIDELAVAHRVDPMRPPPPTPKDVTPGKIYEEYEKLTKLGVKSKKERASGKGRLREVSEADVSPTGGEHIEQEGPGQGRLDLSPHDAEDRVEPADDGVLDFIDDEVILPRRALPAEGEDGDELEAAPSTPVGD